MTSETRNYCFTCKVWITLPRWDRHIVSLGHLRRAEGHPAPFVRHPLIARELESEDGGEDVEDAGSHDDELPAVPPANRPAPCVVYGCPNPRQGGTGHARMHCEEHQQWARPEQSRGYAERQSDDDTDTRTPCGGCSMRITPGSEYWRSDGNAYHVNCVPLTTTRPMNPTQTAQAAPQQAAPLVSGVGVQLGTGEGEEAHSTPEGPIARADRERQEARARNG